MLDIGEMVVLCDVDGSEGEDEGCCAPWSCDDAVVWIHRWMFDRLSSVVTVLMDVGCLVKLHACDDESNLDKIDD